MSVGVEPAVQVDAPRIAREPWLAERVVFVGGHPGCGKTLFTSLLGSFARVEMQKFNYAIEHLCGLALLGRLERDAASALIRMQVDLDIYNLAQSRETNFRFSDLSSAFRNPGKWRYLRRLSLPGDAAAVDRIRKERPILQLTTHNALAISGALFDALGDRVRVIEILRHPLYMLKQWRWYVERYGTDVREFTLWIQHGEQAAPFFAHGWEERFLRANAMDKVIYSIQHLSMLGRQVMDRLSPAQREQVLFIPFEPFVFEPEPHLARLEQFLGTTVTPATRRELKRQRVPRGRIADGIPLAVYKANGWQPTERRNSERDELTRRRDYAAAEATPEAMRVLDELCEEYESTVLRGFTRWP